MAPRTPGISVRERVKSRATRCRFLILILRIVAIPFRFKSPAARETEPTAPVPEHRWRVAGNHRACQRGMPKRAEFPDDCSQQQRRNAAALFHPHNENPIQMRQMLTACPRRTAQTSGRHERDNDRARDWLLPV